MSQFIEKAVSKTEDIEHSLVLLLHLFTLVNKIVCSAVGRRSSDHQLQFRSAGQADLETKMSQLLESVLEPHGCGNHFALWVWRFSLLSIFAYCWYCLPLLYHRASRNYIPLWMYVYVSVLELICILLSQTARVQIPWTHICLVQSCHQSDSVSLAHDAQTCLSDTLNLKFWPMCHTRACHVT